MRIDFDPINLLADMVGPANGVTPHEVKSAETAALAALAGFRRLSDEGHYGFPQLPLQSSTIQEILQYAATVKGSYDTICVAGIGGSALGAWALDCALRGPHPVQKPFSTANPRLVILDNVDPLLVSAALDSMNPRKTLLLVIAKSGATAETVATFLILRDWMEKALGAKKAAQRIVAVTSEKRGDLKLLATSQAYATFHIPDNVGGRFSVLSAVGLLPAALANIDIRKLCKGAAAITNSCWKQDLKENIALQSALYHWLIWTRRKKNIHVAFPYSNRLWGTAFWFRQLWAESLGKRKNRKGRIVQLGQTPVAALGTTDQHSQVQLYMEGPNDKVFTFWTIRKPADAGRIPRKRTGLEAMDYLPGQTLLKLLDAEQRSTAAALTENGRPNCAFTLDKVDEEHIGAFLQMMEFQTAFMGELLNINAFDQEGVELGKKFTFGLMGREGFDEYRQRFADYEAKRSEARETLTSIA